MPVLLLSSVTVSVMVARPTPAGVNDTARSSPLPVTSIPASAITSVFDDWAVTVRSAASVSSSARVSVVLGLWPSPSVPLTLPWATEAVGAELEIVPGFHPVGANARPRKAWPSAAVATVVSVPKLAAPAPPASSSFTMVLAGAVLPLLANSCTVSPLTRAVMNG